MTLVLGMDDVGTRAQHLMDLYDIWTVGLQYMENGHYITVGEQSKIDELKSAIKLLVHHMEHEYRQLPYAAAINQLPEADKIEEGRGTPLVNVKYFTTPVYYTNFENEGESSYTYELGPPVPTEKANEKFYPGKTFFDTPEEAKQWGAVQVIPNMKRLK